MNVFEQLLQTLDSSWSIGNPPLLQELLSQLPERALMERTELCAADLEWRWRQSDPFRPSSGTPPSGAIPGKPTAADYATHLSNAWSHPDCQKRLLEAEWIARSSWGDRPSIDLFALDNGLDPAYAIALVAQLDLVSIVTITVSKETKVLLEVDLPPRVIVGRQNEGEAAAPAWNPEKRRLVVADLLERTLSRDQLELRRTKVSEIEFNNLSDLVHLKMGLVTLRPKQKITTSIPFHFSINDFTISIANTEPLPL